MVFKAGIKPRNSGLNLSYFDVSKIFFVLNFADAYHGRHLCLLLQVEDLVSRLLVGYSPSEAAQGASSSSSSILTLTVSTSVFAAFALDERCLGVGGGNLQR